ncbi:inositol monophosphatase family protein [Tersicoccus phoenicis]|uniref:inositol monophosphatase family protein n=1 Tax=Tersicoccus phoenicis TaxID=554083 RepID=UPI000A03146B|nr:inositol monophosphatase family protein [Tersicoccus phoenicis]
MSVNGEGVPRDTAGAAPAGAPVDGTDGPVDLDALLATARRAAAAGAAVLADAVAGGTDEWRMDATTKSSDSDWVTSYDLAAERAVRAVLSAERPDDVVSGEEFGTSGSDDAAVPTDGSGLRWSVDPLDGTTNFIRGIVYYATSVAVIGAGGRWLAGVVNAPALGVEYSAAAGRGAWRRRLIGDAAQDRPRRLTGPDPERPGRLLATGFSYNGSSRTRQFNELEGLMSAFADVRRLGSAALDLCLVADGTLDAFRESGLHEHDWAAGALIAQEAGCWVHRSTASTALADPAGQWREEGITAATSRHEARRLDLDLDLE